MKEQFNNQNYITIETFRKSGIGVRTPVWFAKDENAFYVWTEANSGKAKRIRRDGAVKIA
ncbi:MAG: PPOX class F420-dependent oxidoreductase, partial [Anaerolineales bacterium]|nr:PPOX class F420-dependent oxidoreductase [Anaerolineales bacterium]